MNIFTILLTQPLANGLVLFYKLFGQNMGVAIILFAAFLKLILTPLTKTSMENMKKMNELRPQIEKLKKKHKGDRQKFMKAQADFYKEKGFNPGAGCLPQILQIVVLYAFLGLFNTVFKSNTDLVAAYNPLLYEPLKFAEDAIINTRFLYLDVLRPDVINVPGISFPFPGPILIMSAITQFISAKIMLPVLEKEEKIAKKTSSGTDDALIASQQYTVLMLPFLTIIFGIQFASGLALYWLVFSVIQAYQQYRAAGWGGLTPTINRLQRVINR
jgi:YidC/Oxa1 family membrane protein insertase